MARYVTWDDRSPVLWEDGSPLRWVTVDPLSCVAGNTYRRWTAGPVIRSFDAGVPTLES